MKVTFVKNGYNVEAPCEEKNCESYRFYVHYPDPEDF